MAWSSSAESCGDSITELFKHLCKLHCVSDRKVFLHRPKTSTVHTQRKALRTLYDVLFEYHLGDLKHCDRLSMFHSMTPDLWMFEYIYDLRRGRQFDKADKLEKLFTHLQNDDSVDLSEMDSVLTILLLLADTSPVQGSHTIGHEGQHLPVVVYGKKDDNHLLPEGPALYRDSAVYKPDSAHYMHYPRSLFEGEPLTDLGYLSMESSLSDDLDLSSKGSLFGGLVQPKQIALNDRLELPDFPESGVFEIHIPQKREKQVPPETLDISVMSSGFISDVQLRPSTTHWDDCQNMTQSQFFTWDKRGRRGPTEKPYMTELGQRGVQEWSNIKRRELCLFSPDLQPPPVRKFTPKQVTQDLLHLMIGIPSHLFVINKELQTFYLGEGCELNGLTPEAFQSFVGDFIDCGTRYCRLRAFCASSTIYNGGLIFQAFLVALNRVLHHYAAVVLSIQSLNILQLKFLCHKLFTQMKYLSTMCHCEQPVRMQQLEAFPKGVELLSYLYQETTDSINTDNYPMMLSILQTSCGPYNLFVKEWVYHGVLCDTYGEFMITVNDDYLRFRDKHYWSHSYTMMDHDVEFVPGFLHNLASDIFICGKSLNLLRTCSPHHFLCEVKELDIPRISLTFSDSELHNTMTQCQMYISKMKQIARQQTMSRQAAEDQAMERKRDLMRRAKAAATKEVERIQEAILKKRTLADAKKREQFAILKKQMEEDLQRRSDSVSMEKKADKERMELLLIQEREMTEKEKELEAEARAEIIDYYAKLTKEATEREEKAMWKIRRSVLNEARRNFLSEDEKAWREEMDANPEGRKIDRALWEVKRSEEADLDLPSWARRVIAKPAPLIPAIEEPEAVELPAWAARRLSSLEKESSRLSEHQPEVSRGRRVNVESEEETAKPAIHVFHEHHPSKETTDITTAKSQIHIVSDRHCSKESEPVENTKIGVKLSSHMSATTETESKEYKPHLKSHGDMNATKESTETKEVSFPKRKGQEGSGVSAETQEKEWKVKPASLYGHVSQLSKQEVQINVPRLKRPEEIYASLESDYKDYGIKPRIRMSKKMSATKESEATDGPRSGIKFSSVMSSTKESEWIDVDKARLEKFKRQNIHGHSSDSTVQALLYGPKRDKAAVDELPAFPPIEWTSSIQYAPVPYQDNFDICCQPPVVDLLMMSSGMVYGGHGDYGISQMTDVGVYDYLPLSEIMERSVVAPLASQISLVNESLLDYFFVELHLMDHLKALRRYLLMENGDFAQMLSDMLFEKISSPVSAREMLTPLFLNSALSKALKSTTQTDDKLAENLSFAFKYPPGHIPAKGRSVLDCMELRYIVSWPINIVITEESVNKYNQIFSFMLLQKQTVWVLKDVWHRLKRAALLHKAGNASQFRCLQLYRQEMQHFVRVMQGYISHQVIFVTWNEFKSSLKSDVQNLDDLIRVHDDYLNRAIFRCLLNTKAAKIMKIMRDMFNLILQFRTLLVAADWRRDKTTGEVSHDNFNHMYKCFQNFRQYSVFLFKVISKLVKRGYQSHLQDFLLRLNFNDYYRDT
ncbi:gamma-tubulin complex component 6-like [Saccostrea echinata]|uniref:gamma-tubulin complex component 6-like n=1 Tax=Saccostrea echinata TaxID=191078 RepID=UPI002A8270E2|nr:gamma-tubulin complex component 6-like [Saccostrea echinata]